MHSLKKKLFQILQHFTSYVHFKTLIGFALRVTRTTGYSFKSGTSFVGPVGTLCGDKGLGGGQALFVINGLPHQSFVYSECSGATVWGLQSTGELASIMRKGRHFLITNAAMLIPSIDCKLYKRCPRFE